MPITPPRPHQPPARRLLLLSPSAGLGGGIERVMNAVESAWPGPVARVNLLESAPEEQPRADVSVRPWEIARFAARAFGAARAGRPDVIVCGLLGLLPVASILGVVLRRRVALLTYGLDVWGRIGRVERMLIRRCAPLLTISAFTAEAFANRIGVDTRRIGILMLPMADLIAAEARAPVAGHRSRPPVVLTVARVARSDRFKGHFAIAQCFGRVLEQRPDARWLIVGDGDDLPALRAECQRLGIEEAVTFTGRVSDAELVRLYRSAAVFALPSIANADAQPPVGEGFGLVYVEAGAFGLPIIAATPGGGSAEFVIDGETGLTVRPDRVDELADTIVRLLDDADLRTRLGENARARAFARHLPAHFREELTQSLL